MSPPLQALASVAALAVAAALVYLGVSHIGYVRLIGKEELAVARAESANVDLQDDVARLRDRLAVAARDRTAAQDRLSVLANQADALRSELESTETKLRQFEQKFSEREPLQPQEAIPEAGPVEPVVSQPTPSETKPAHPDVGASDTSSMNPKRAAEDVSDLIRRRVLDEFERILASVGVDAGHLFSRFAVNRAQGGPFFLPPRADQPADNIGAGWLAGVRGLANSLPLSTPLEHFQVGSRFGPRRDPFNGRAAFHTGLDLDAAYMSPVYATAPGIVTYTGYRGDYGKVVEIDHGSGIATLYGHLHRYTVSTGQRVGAHTQIGLLGSTGRASGPHVHYEVIVNGEPRDPEKFIGLAHLAPIADK